MQDLESLGGYFVAYLWWSLDICTHPFQPGLPSLLLCNFLPNRKIIGGSVDKGAWDSGGFDGAGIYGKEILEVALTCSWCNIMVGLEMGGDRVQSEMAASICGAFVKMLSRKPSYLILTIILWGDIIIILILYVRSLIVREIKSKGIQLASGQIRTFHPGLWFRFCLYLSDHTASQGLEWSYCKERGSLGPGLDVCWGPRLYTLPGC